MKDHLNAVITALEAWRDSLPTPTAAVTTVKPAPAPIKPTPRPRKTEAEEEAEIAAAGKRLAQYRFHMKKGTYLHIGEKRRASVREINDAAGRHSMAPKSWAGRYSPAQWVGYREHEARRIGGFVVERPETQNCRRRGAGDWHGPLLLVRKEADGEHLDASQAPTVDGGYNAVS